MRRSVAKGFGDPSLSQRLVHRSNPCQELFLVRDHSHCVSILRLLQFCHRPHANSVTAQPRQPCTWLPGLLFHTMGLGRVELPTSRLSGQLRWRSPTLTDVFEHEMRTQCSPVSANIGQCCYSFLLQFRPVPAGPSPLVLLRASSFYYSVLTETLKARRTTSLDHERDDEVRSLRPEDAVALVE